MRTNLLYALGGCSVTIPGLGWVIALALITGPQAANVVLGMAALGLASATADLTLAHRWKGQISSSDKDLCTALATAALVLNGMGAAFCLLGWAVTAYGPPIGFD